MIVEFADMRVDPKHQTEFIEILRRGVELVLSEAQGYKSHEIISSLETPGKYVLIVRWDTVEDHTVRFRESTAFGVWRSMVGPFFITPPAVEHFAGV